jgi:membrane fusion protein (multidrug efflux system)
MVDMSSPAVSVAPPPPDTVPTRRPSKRTLGFSALAAVLLFGGVWAAWHWGDESTDDAQVDADVVPVPARTVAVVKAIHFEDNAEVKAGDLLIELDDGPSAAKLAEAEAALQSAMASVEGAEAYATVQTASATGNKAAAQAGVISASSAATSSNEQIREGEASILAAKANADMMRVEIQRAEQLLSTNAIARAAYDQTRARADAANASLAEAQAKVARLKAEAAAAASHVSQAHANLAKVDNVPAQVAMAKSMAATAHAQLASAKAKLALATLDHSYTKIYAPQDGVVSRRSVSVGQLVQNGQAVVQLVPSKRLWVTANFKETQLAKMKVGQPAEIEVDYSGEKLHGKVESFSGATGSKFALLPPDNATGNFTKVVQRLPVRIAIEADGRVLRPGMNVVATVHTSK